MKKLLTIFAAASAFYFIVGCRSSDSSGNLAEADIDDDPVDCRDFGSTAPVSKECERVRAGEDVSFGKLEPFTSDGCSSYPDGTDADPTKWLHCCVEHDVRYWAGGTDDERLVADEELRDCVAATGEDDQAEIIFTGVRAGGSPIFDTSYKWGYGWPDERGSASLNKTR
jgi:hypothetical protein